MRALARRPGIQTFCTPLDSGFVTTGPRFARIRWRRPGMTACPKVFKSPSMLSVIIPTEGVEQPAVATLAALVPGAAAGVVREVLLVDRSGTGVIERVADVAGCRFLAFEGTRAAALAAGARAARSPRPRVRHADAV